MVPTGDGDGDASASRSRAHRSSISRSSDSESDAVSVPDLGEQSEEDAGVLSGRSHESSTPLGPDPAFVSRSDSNSHTEPKASTSILALPDELLAQIFSFVPGTALPSVRLTCSTFERAAWVPYARSINQHIFHPTHRSLSSLLTLASNPFAVSYMTQIRISTIKLLQSGPRTTWDSLHREAAELRRLGYEPIPHNPGQLQWMKEGRQRRALAKLLRSALGKLTGVGTVLVVGDEGIPSVPEPTNDEIQQQMSNPTSRLSKAAVTMPISVRLWLTLRRLESPQYRDVQPNTVIMADIANWHTAAHLEELCGWLFEPRAHRHALDIIHRAIVPSPYDGDVDVSRAPVIRGLKTQGRVNVASLFGCTRPLPQLQMHTRPVLTQMTHLDLALTAQHFRYDIEEKTKDIRYYVPDMLSTMPNLTNLTLEFPDKRADEAAATNSSPLLRTTTIPLSGVFYDTLFNTLNLPHLQTLNLQNLSSPSPSRPNPNQNQTPAPGYDLTRTLIPALRYHRSTLKHLTFTNVYLIIARWRGVIQFLGEEMALQTFTLALEDVGRDDDEEGGRRVRWEDVGRQYRPTSEELRAVSGSGVTWVEGGVVVFRQR